MSGQRPSTGCTNTPLFVSFGRVGELPSPPRLVMPPPAWATPPPLALPAPLALPLPALAPPVLAPQPALATEPAAEPPPLVPAIGASSGLGGFEPPEQPSHRAQ